MCSVCLTADDLFFRTLEDEGEKEVVAALAKAMGKITSKAWIRESNRAISKSIKAMLSKSDVKQGVKVLNSQLEKDLAKIYTTEEVKKLTAAIRLMYRSFKKVATDGLKISFSFSQLDKRAVKALSKEHPFWINTFYTKQLSKRIADVSQKVVIDQGLGRIEGGKAMREILKQDLSWVGGPAEIRGIDVIPARFAGNVKGYTEIVSANAVNRGRNFGFISGYRDAGIERYRWNSVMDRRTSEICIELDGREFQVGKAVGLMNDLNAADSPEDVKELNPWVSVKQLKQIAGKGSQAKQSQNLSKAGIMFPPAHGRCRSVVEAVL